jgi:hypothetical protein
VLALPALAHSRSWGRKNVMARSAGFFALILS